MYKYSKNENGFSVVEVILIFVIVALIGVVGWLAYKDHGNTTTRYTATTSSNNAIIARKTPSTSTSTSNIKYLTISQWGVKAPYISTDTLTYIMSATNLATVVSKNMSDNYGCTGTNNLPSGAGGISRNIANNIAQVMTMRPETYAQLAQQDSADYKQVGSYVYGFTRDQAACSNKTLGGTPGETAQVNAENFTNSLLPKLEAIQ